VADRDTPDPPGIWFGVDVGTVRVGVARSDPHGLLAVPVVTLARDARTDRDIAELAGLVAEYEATGVVVGLPRTLAGREGAAAVSARAYGSALAERVAPVPVEYVDERLTTVSAQRKLSQGGVRGSAGRAVIDQAAAVELLQHWLDMHRRRPGSDASSGETAAEGSVST
jgi:putative holliday junction resolvase